MERITECTLRSRQTLVNAGRRQIANCGIKSLVFRTAFGWAGVALSARGICRIVLPKNNKKVAEKELVQATPLWSSSEGCLTPDADILIKAAMLLRRYFTGKRVSFDVPLDLRYSTPFQRAVWEAVSEIPHGGTRSYVWVAKRIGKPLASRAVGQAVGANPVPIIIP